MAALVGHQNHKQKIQYTMSLKRDNDALKAANVEMGEDAANLNPNPNPKIPNPNPNPKTPNPNPKTPDSNPKYLNPGSPS